MKQIRHCAFETNSSSTHTITIQKENVLDNIECASFDYRQIQASYENKRKVSTCKASAGSFGWEHERYDDFGSKLMYLLLAITATDSGNKKLFNKHLRYIKSWLKGVHVIVDLPPYVSDVRTYKDSNGIEKSYNYSAWYPYDYNKGKCRFSDWLYIDHGEDLGEFVNYVMSDKNHLYNYLFGVKSFIETGNDNDDTFPWWWNRYYKNFDEKWNHYKEFWVKNGEDAQEVYNEMRSRETDDEFHVTPDDVVEFYKGN